MYAYISSGYNLYMKNSSSLTAISILGIALCALSLWFFFHFTLRSLPNTVPLNTDTASVPKSFVATHTTPPEQKVEPGVDYSVSAFNEETPTETASAVENSSSEKTPTTTHTGFDALHGTPSSYSSGSVSIELPSDLFDYSYLLLEPFLSHATVWNVPIAGGVSPMGKSDEDLFVQFPSAEVFGSIKIRGYRNVVIVGGTVRLTSTFDRGAKNSRAAIEFYNTYSGVKYIKGLVVHTEYDNRGGVLVSSARGAQPNVVIAHSNFFIHDTDKKVGALLLEGDFSTILLHALVATTNFYGFNLAPYGEHRITEVIMNDIHIMPKEKNLRTAELLRVRGEKGETTVRGITLRDVTIEPVVGISLGSLVYPGSSGSLPIGAEYRLQQYSFEGTPAGRWVFSTSAGEGAVKGRVLYLTSATTSSSATSSATSTQTTSFF